jgi:uncharacterized protein YkwD
MVDEASMHPRPFLAIAVALALGGCGARAPRIALRPSPADAAFEQQVYTAVNEYRLSRRLPALAWSEVAASQARDHSQRMAAGARSLGHRDFHKRVSAIAGTMRLSRAAENVVRSRSAARAIELWLKNRGHRRNIEGRYDLTGIGAARSEDGLIYFTEIFLESR